MNHQYISASQVLIEVLHSTHYTNMTPLLYLCLGKYINKDTRINNLKLLYSSHLIFMSSKSSHRLHCENSILRTGVFADQLAWTCEPE